MAVNRAVSSHLDWVSPNRSQQSPWYWFRLGESEPEPAGLGDYAAGWTFAKYTQD